MAKELTIVVPALNEETKLPVTVEEALAEASRHLDAYELIIVNDGSVDRTGAVAEELARKHRTVRVIHQPVNCGVGAAFHAALAIANYQYITLIPGDNAFHQSGVSTLFSAVGQADLVISYRQNKQARTTLRRFLSRCCSLAMRILTGCPIRDAHSMFIFPVAEARRLPVETGYTYHMKALSTLLQRVGSYLEVPVLLNPKPDASSGVMKFRTLRRLIGAMAGLYLRRFTFGLFSLPRRPVRKELVQSTGYQAAPQVLHSRQGRQPLRESA